MIITLTNIVAYITVLVFTFSVIKYIIVDPLATSIDLLRLSINQINSKMESTTAKLIQVEASTKFAHQRLNELIHQHTKDDSE